MPDPISGVKPTPDSPTGGDVKLNPADSSTQTGKEDPKDNPLYPRVQELANKNKDLEGQMGQLMNLLQEQNQNTPQPAAGQPNVPVNDPLVERGREVLTEEGYNVVQELITRERKSVEQDYADADDARVKQDVHQQVYATYPELANPNSPEFQKVAREYQTLARMGVTTPFLPLIAAQKALGDRTKPVVPPHPIPKENANFSTGTPEHVPSSQQNDIPKQKFDTGKFFGFNADQTKAILKKQ